MVILQLTEAQLDLKLMEAAVRAEKKKEPSKYVNTDDACKILGNIHKNTLRAHHQKGDFAAYRRGRELMFKRQDLYDYLENNRIG